MCGICGQLNLDPGRPADMEAVRRMTAAIVHRGPDDEGFHSEGPLGLGFRRLSIIDLAAGRQPMSDRDGRVWIVFNGEIYNYRELRQQLIERGHSFRTNSDTEVIVNGYLEWGVDVLKHLNGMFGLAVWDRTARRLMLARDRLGIKPLYYRVDAGTLSFGSEMRSVLAGAGGGPPGANGRPEIDPTGMYLFLRYRYTPAPRTIFKGVCKLATGTRLIVEDGRHRVERWWDYRPQPFDPMPPAAEAVERLAELYKLAIRRQLVSDVPVGLLLSGGVDSGLLLALMHQNGESWKTFTVGYEEDYYFNEVEPAAETAAVFGSPNFGVRLSREQFEETIPRTIAILEEPIAAPSVVPMYYLCRRAREDVKVVLMGQGPDELFGGYRRHLGVYYSRYFRAAPAWARSLLKSALSRLPRCEPLKRSIYSLDVEDRLRRYQQIFSIMPEAELDGLFADGLLPRDAGDAILDCWKPLVPLMAETDELGGMQFLELRSSLPDELLMYGDKISMAHGLEARVPFLDHELVEYVEGLEASYKVRNGKGKWIHRQICRRMLPHKILARRKLGFQTPVDEWFRRRLDSTLVDDESVLYDYLEPAAVRKLISDHQSGRQNNFKILFSLVTLEKWLQIHR